MQNQRNAMQCNLMYHVTRCSIRVYILKCMPACMQALFRGKKVQTHPQPWAHALNLQPYSFHGILAGVPVIFFLNSGMGCMAKSDRHRTRCRDVGFSGCREPNDHRPLTPAAQLSVLTLLPPYNNHSRTCMHLGVVGTHSQRTIKSREFFYILGLGSRGALIEPSTLNLET